MSPSSGPSGQCSRWFAFGGKVNVTVRSIRSLRLRASARVVAPSLREGVAVLEPHAPLHRHPTGPVHGLGGRGSPGTPGDPGHGLTGCSA